MNTPRRRHKNRFHRMEYSEWIAGNDFATDSGGFIVANSSFLNMLSAQTNHQVSF